jgi:DNA-binding transcriptional regulator YdaS (Cro superfamily)
MDLREFIKSYPRAKRMSVRRMIADAHGVAEVTVRAWANGNRNHPYKLSAVRTTESVTGGRVTRHDLRPDIFGSANRRREPRL